MSYNTNEKIEDSGVEVSPDVEVSECHSDARHGSISLTVLLMNITLMAALMAGFAMFILNIEITHFVDEIQPDANVFDVSTSEPAGALLEHLWHPVEKAVLVKHYDPDSFRKLVCMEDEFGDVEVIEIRRRKGTVEIFNRRTDDEAKLTILAFCDAAFSRATKP